MAATDPAGLAELARRDGRLGLDTEFMPEGRYRPLLCLVQIAAGGEIAVLDPLVGFDPAQPGLPVSLIVDDPAPCINPFYYFRLQVDREGWERHEQRIPLDFLAQFAGVCRSHGIRGKS